MPRVRLIALALALSACTPSGGSPSLALTPSNAATSAAATGRCIDRGQLADSADSVAVTLQGVIAALKSRTLNRRAPWRVPPRPG
jgi:hypothetical protein